MTPLTRSTGLAHLLQLQLRPHEAMHPSWLPPTWPVRWRRWQSFGPAGQRLLAHWLRSSLPTLDHPLDTPRKRMLLMDGPSLRRLSLFCGLALHTRLMAQRGPLASQLRRQAHRLGEDAADFALSRMPALSAFRIDAQRLQARPAGAGRVIVDRGYRLIQAAFASEGAAVLSWARRSLPRRAAALRPLALQPQQLDQLDELMLMCILPEKLPQWDWLT